jgi:hypothetical protein
METTGPRQGPKPTLAMIEGPRTSVAKAPCGLIRPNQANPVAVSSAPPTVAELDREHGAGDHAEGERQELDPGHGRPDPEHSLETEGHEIEGRGHGGADQEVVGRTRAPRSGCATLAASLVAGIALDESNARICWRPRQDLTLRSRLRRPDRSILIALCVTYAAFPVRLIPERAATASV